MAYKSWFLIFFFIQQSSSYLQEESCSVFYILNNKLESELLSKYKSLVENFSFNLESQSFSSPQVIYANHIPFNLHRVNYNFDLRISKLRGFCLKIMLEIRKSQAAEYNIILEKIKNSTFGFSHNENIYFILITSFNLSYDYYKSLQQTHINSMPELSLMHPKILLVNFIQQLLIECCPVCPIDKEIFQTADQHLVFHKAITQSKQFGYLTNGYVFETANLAANELCYDDSIRRHRETTSSDCEGWSIFLGVISNKLNITLFNDPEANFEPEDPKALLHICIWCNPIAYLPDIENYNPLQVNWQWEDHYIMYCYKQNYLVEPSWEILIRPFDIYTWVLIFIDFLLISAIQRNLWYGIDFLTALLGQPLQRKWSKHISWIYCIVIFITILYNAKISSYTIKPREQERISNYPELLSKNQYKFLIADESSIQGAISFFEQT